MQRISITHSAGQTVTYDDDEAGERTRTKVGQTDITNLLYTYTDNNDSALSNVTADTPK